MSEQLAHSIVSTQDAPAPIAPFSQATVYNGMIYCSGNLGMDPITMKLIEDGVEQRTVRGEILSTLLLNRIRFKLSKTFQQSWKRQEVVSRRYWRWMSSWHQWTTSPRWIKDTNKFSNNLFRYEDSLLVEPYWYSTGKDMCLCQGITNELWCGDWVYSIYLIHLNDEDNLE